MKTINQYITEAFRLRDDTKITKKTSRYTHQPKTHDELVELICAYVEEHGPGTKENPVDLNFIDITKINDWGKSTFAYIRGPKYGQNIYVDISGWDVSNIEDFNCFFYNSYRLYSVGDLSRWDTRSAKSFSCMFYRCDCLTDLGDLGEWNTEKCESFTAMFNGCKNLESIGDISRWNTSSAISFAEMFKECESLQNIGNLDGWKTSSVKYMKQMFAYCKSLENIGELTYWNTDSLQDIHEMFYCCERLKTIGYITRWNINNIPRGKRNQKCNDIFSGCYAMTSFPLWWDEKNKTIKRNYK